MAIRKEFEYKINVDTSAANKNLQSSVKQINLTNKSISDLNKELRRQIAVYKELTAEQRGSDIGKQVQENIQAIQQELKKANDAIKISSQESVASAEKVGEAINQAFDTDRAIDAFEKLSGAFELESIEQGFDNVADAIGSLDPRLKLVAEVGKRAFREILESIKLTQGGARQLEGFLGGLKEVLTFKNLISVSGIPQFLFSFKRILREFREGELAALKKFDLERENVLRNSAIVEIEINKSKNETILNDENKTFKEQAQALKDNLNLELKAADERRMIGINELEIFKQQKEIRKLIESRGAEFTNELNAEQLAQYQAIQDKIKQATNERVLAQINFEQEYRRLFRQEQERLLQIFIANQNKIIEENEFRIENERLTLDQTLQLLQDNYQKRAKIIDSELAILDKNNKEDQVRFVELNNEKLALQRDFELQKEQIVAEFTQREISLQEAKNASIIAINNKYNELFKGTLEQQIQRIEQNAELQLEINQRKIDALDEQDKNYLINLQNLENEREQIVLQKNEAILRQSIAFYDAQLQELQKNIEISTKKAELQATKLSSQMQLKSAEIQEKIAQITEESSKNIVKAITNYKALKEAQEKAFQTRVEQIQIQADLERKQNEAQIIYNQAQIERLKKELEFGELLSEARKKQIEQEIELLNLAVEQLSEKQTQIDIKVKIDTEGAKKELQDSLSEIDKSLVSAAQESINKVNEGFNIVANFFKTAIDLQLQAQLEAIENQEKSIDEFLENNEKAIRKTQELENNATGARQRRLRKERKEMERLQEQELERKKQLEQEKTEAERKAKEKMKIFQIGQVLIDTAAGIVNAVAKFPETFGMPFAAFVAATGALQLAAINAVKFARGGVIRYDEGGNLAFFGGYIPAEGGMIEGLSHAEGGVKFFMGNGIGEADGKKGEAYIVNTRNNPILKKLASDINVLGGGKAFFADGGIINAQPSALGILTLDTQLKNMQDAIIEAFNQEKVIVPVDFLTEKMEKALAKRKRLLR